MILLKTLLFLINFGGKQKMNTLEKEIQHYFREILGVLSTGEIISNKNLVMRANHLEVLLTNMRMRRAR